MTRCTFHTMRPQFVESYNIFDQNLGFEPQNMPWGGIPRPTGPQHKHRDFPSSHFVGTTIFAQNPSNYSRTT